MTEDGKPGRRLDDMLRARFERRRAKMREEIARNREGGHRVPTWVLTVILVAIVATWVGLIVTS